MGFFLIKLHIFISAINTNIFLTVLNKNCELFRTTWYENLLQCFGPFGKLNLAQIQLLMIDKYLREAVSM